MWSQNLDKHQWNERVIMIFADKEHKSLAEQQCELIIKNNEKFLDQRIVLYKCIEDQCTFYDFKDTPKTLASVKDSKGFKIILIGLDGGEKFSSDTFVKPDVIVELIDTMPMRQQELRTREKNE